MATDHQACKHLSLKIARQTDAFTRDIGRGKRIGLVSMLLLLTSGYSACSPPEFEPPKTPPPPQRSFSVTLPPSIDLNGEIPKLKHPDQTFRVDGLLMQAHKFMDDDLSITGYVSEISPCSNKVGDTCPKPYVWITDDIGELDLRIRVADMKRSKLRRFKVGRKYTFQGKFSQKSKSGYANSRGVLSLTKFSRAK